MKNLLLITACAAVSYLVFSYTNAPLNIDKIEEEYPKALVDYDDFKTLVDEVEKHRGERLVDLETFLAMSKEPNTIILDARSDFRYKRKHIKGAIHLSFTDFTQENLSDVVTDPNTRILIYCNNNFEGDPIDFATKSVMPISPSDDDRGEVQILSNQKPIMLALNIPTYINLYGYGYKNIYELDELVNINDMRIEFEGTEVK